jgi:hypothetical protein
LVKLDMAHDRATIYLGEERQTYDEGGTYLVLTDPAEVQLGFEGEDRLVFVSVCPASKVLPAELLAQAERR